MTRRSALRTPLQAIVCVTLAVAPAAGCTGDTANERSKPDTRRSSTTKTATAPTSSRPLGIQWGNGLDFRVELLTLARTPADAVITKFRITSYEPDGLDFYDFHRRVPHTPRPAGQLTGISLVDIGNHKRYLPLIDEEDICLCTQYTAFTLEMRHSAKVYAYFPAPPSDVGHMTVVFPLAGPFLHVRLSTLDHPPQLPSMPSDGGMSPRRPTEVSTKARIVPLISRVFDTDNNNAVQRRGDKTTVQLSAKVLFDLNKATLRPAARKELRDVARRIEEASPATVHVDGYTDSSGTPAINIPLSKRRAQAVKRALQEMVDDSSVRFVAEGHGANNPIADNSTAEGRQLNRRVTVTFAQ